MAALCMSEPTTTDEASYVASPSKKLMRRSASTHDRSRRNRDRVSIDPRMLRVLVVDHEQDSAADQVNLVRRCGHTARVAIDGHSALRMAAAQNPDVVLLDLEIPLMEGREVARRLRVDFPSEDCFIIAVSERADDVGHYVEAGIDLLLVKPLDLLVVEMLLLLECVRANGRRALGATTSTI